VAESCFQPLKREKVRRRKYRTREEARQDVFEYIELFNNPKSKHTNNGMLSPVHFEERQLKLQKGRCLGNYGHLRAHILLTGEYRWKNRWYHA